MDYKIVFFDIDGTLLDSKGEIPVSTKNAVKLLKEKDIEVCIATGRPLVNSVSIGKELGIDSFLTFNGSHVIYKGKEVFKKPIPSNIVKGIMERANTLDVPIVLNAINDNYGTNTKDPYVRSAIKHLCFEPTEIQNNSVVTEQVYQMLLFAESTIEKKMMDVLENLKLVRWHKYCSDIFLPNVSKSLGIEKLLNLLDLSPSESIAFGDGLNDKEMLEFVGMGVAMENSPRELFQYADMITSDSDSDGIYEGLKKLNVI